MFGWFSVFGSRCSVLSNWLLTTSCSLLVAGCWLMMACGTGQVFGQNFRTGALNYPWAGGLNSCQFGKIDLDLNGIDDLVIFDRHGNRILPFISDGSRGMDGYSYHPEFKELLPDLHDWVILRDYNCDGKEDIFTYSLGGMRVFKNISDTVLKFQLVTDLLTSYYYTGKVGILLTPVDYPAISDIDGDGDLDILTFFGLGSYVEYHKNLSKEKNGNCDSLDYRLSAKCWGDFKESEGGNNITLDITCPYKYHSLPAFSCSDPLKNQKHTGSTLLATDLDGNGMQDLMLGDIDFPGLIALFNGGTTDTAHMISQDTLFPVNSRPVRLFSFPSASLTDIDNDDMKDLIVSPFDPSLYISENYKSLWFYKNTGTAIAPDFQFRTDRFMQEEMIDVGSNSFPVLSDISGDGLPDLMIGNWGYYDSSWYHNGVLHSSFISKIAYFRNNGTPRNPAFRLETNDFAGLSSLDLTGLYPAFGDLDNDGDADMVTGCSDGTLVYFENISGAGNPPSYAPAQLKYQNIDAGESSAPQLFDLDKDGLLDLVIGERKGNLNYYRNAGTVSSPVFNFITDSLGKVNVTNYNLSYDGYSTPCFFYSQGNNIELIVGSEEGKIHYFKDIEENLNGKFPESDSLYTLISVTPFAISSGWRTSACIANLSDTNFKDLVVGNFSGGLNYFSNKTQPAVNPGINNKSPLPEYLIHIYPNPADDLVTVDITNVSLIQDSEVRIYNLLGQTIYKNSFHNSLSISTSLIPAGIYIIRIRNTSKKLIIQHF